MKKILLLFTALFILSSCNMEPDEAPQYNVEFLPADWVIFPQWVEPGHTYEVRVGFTKPNGCYLFDHFVSEKDGNAVVIAIQTMVRLEGECRNYEKENKDEQSFTFSCDESYALANDIYTFKFFTGYDVEGNKTYEQIVIPVKK
ncbi:membrane lipoprotein lipid attachment site-containing protein [Flavobacterium suzhouense]|uniref:Type IV secretion system putative lipoprotein virB7 n=1 Tax=Flavobacterium suzhouense TaxID=1529638 RepID=A0ABW5NWL9_9FLAO